MSGELIFRRMDLDDAALLAAMPSDTDAATRHLFDQCPPAIRPRSLSIALISHLYAVVDDRTAVDQEVEQHRVAHTLRVLQLPSSREERAVVHADAYAAAMATDAAAADTTVEREALEAGVRVLPMCTGVAVRKPELAAALVGIGDTSAVIEALLRRNWLAVTSRSAAAPDAAPTEGEWLWALPECGKLTTALYPLRAEALRQLHRQRFGRAMRHTLDQGLSKLLRR